MRNDPTEFEAVDRLQNRQQRRSRKQDAYECELCGCAVLNRDQHNEWHVALAQVVADLQARTDALSTPGRPVPTGPLPVL